MSKDYDLNRFVEAQEASYQQALREIKQGEKQTHWIWYIFPQLKGFGFSYNSEYYGIADANEAQAYLAHPVLGARLREITEVLINLSEKAPALSPDVIFGSLDAMKVKSCMTLFEQVSHEAIFGQVLDRMYGGQRDKATLAKLA
ncbi:MAG: DUF1810 domain-containing protein [Mediterranea sp.]|nr:DUF1810 domain-containing protein [Mediterranea sp.]